MATATVAIPAVHFRNILFATDFSEYSQQALPYVTSLAGKFGSNVYLYHVVTPSQLLIGAPEAAPYLYGVLDKTSKEELTGMVHLPELKGLKTKAILANGMLEDELLKASNENQIDLIVLAARTQVWLGWLEATTAAATRTICKGFQFFL